MLFINKENNLVNIISRLLDLRGAKYTKQKILRDIEEHVDYPSLLSVCDLLNNYGITSVGIRKGKHEYTEFETPFICTIQKEDWPQPDFSLVLEATEDTITYVNPISSKEENIPIDKFKKIDKEILLLLDSSGTKDEENYVENQKKEMLSLIYKIFPIFLFIVILLVAVIYQINNSNSEITWLYTISTVSGCIGVIFSLLLIWFDVDSRNPLLKEVCGGPGQKLNCKAVLASSGSAFLKISWSIWGASYFITLVISHILFGNQISISIFWAWVSIIVFPYVIYSLIYQWKIVKQWCPLCLGVQLVLIILASNSSLFLAKNNIQYALEVYPIIGSIGIGVCTVILLVQLVPILKTARDSRSYEKSWKQLRYNSDIFNILLKANNNLFYPTENLGVVIGNQTAENEIVKVCNPYCGPCSASHLELENLLATKNNVRVRIIFTATGGEDDIRTNPVGLLLSIQENKDYGTFLKALSDWYKATEKNYETFAKKYQMNVEEIQKQKQKMIDMSNWCDKMKIRVTPTYFVNGHELPESYKVSELKYLF